jgi:hypothetical protein
VVIGQQILSIGRAIEATFSSSEWTEIGLLTSSADYINRHPRLLRSLHWGDDDYKGCVLSAVEVMLQSDSNNLSVLVNYPVIKEWMKENDRASFDALLADVYGTTVPEVIPTGSVAAMHALADAQLLLENGRAVSAVDRVHTGLHGFLKSSCERDGIPYEQESTPNQLLKLLLEKHPVFQDMGPRGEEIRRMIRSSASIIDSMGTLRNRASLAHANEDLLDHDGALFMVNLARSLLAFLDGKMKSHHETSSDDPFKPCGQ